MKCVLLNQNRSSIHHPGQFAAKLKPSPSPYLKYRFEFENSNFVRPPFRLLTGSFDVPIYVSLIAARSSFGEHGNCIVLLIHISTHPNNPSAANGESLKTSFYRNAFRKHLCAIAKTIGIAVVFETRFPIQ